MKVLVTGASGFLGRHVTHALRRRGHDVHAVVRTAGGGSVLCDVGAASDLGALRILRADLRQPGDLTGLCAGIDVVVHLAAVVAGDEESQFRGTVVGTENLLREVHVAGISRLVLASSFSVYDWQRCGRVLDETSPLESDPYRRDGYAIAKIWQERLTRRFSCETNTQLTVLRPGFIWGRENLDLAGIGQRIGNWYLVFGPHRRLPLTYVENCAECFAICVDAPAAAGTFNVIDADRVSAWRYAGRLVRLEEFRGRRLWIPYSMAAGNARLATWLSRRIFTAGGKLPGILMPNRFAARFRPLRFSDARVRQELGWQSRWPFHDAWRRATDVSGRQSPVDRSEVVHG